MCKETQGSTPAGDSKPTLTEVKPMVIHYLEKPGNEVGGSLHVFLDDCNWGLGSIEGCREWALERDDIDGVELCDVLMRMSKTQRKKIAENNYNWFPVDMRF